MSPSGANGSRLSEPLVRDRGKLRPASWEEALERAAEGFKRELAVTGPGGSGPFSSSKATHPHNH